VAEIIAGCIAIGFGLLVLTGRIGERDAAEAAPPPNRWATLLREKVTARTAAIAGPVTHLPGIFYLVALNLIASHRVWPHSGLLSLLLYNGVWFCVPVAALAICIINPTLASEAIGAIIIWIRPHSRVILLSVSFGIGAALLISGLQKT
jgi:hypothetical protein